MRRRSAFLGTALASATTAVLVLSGCAPSSTQEVSVRTVELGIPDENYSLDALIAAAQEEGPLVVSDTTGKIVDIAAAFEAEYGIPTTGTKLTGQEQVEIATREAQAGAVRTDVLLMTASEAAVADLIPQEVVTTWMPPDLVDEVPAEFQEPLMVTQEPMLIAYNADAYPDGCPVDNIWQLTAGPFSDRFVTPDPLLYAYQTSWYNQMEENHDTEVADAFEAEYGAPLETEEESATAEWVKRLAESKPLVTNDDDDSAAAVGAPGQEDPFIGIMSAAKFRDNAEKGYALAICSGLDPWAGLAYTKAGVIATGTASPNAAKLFIRYMLTEAGIGPQVADGKISTNTTVSIPADEPSGVAEVWDEILVFDSASLESDYFRAQDWADFWRLHHR
ncbi:ABC transporter substrate-binding protein [Leucobacter sp. Psy1]|uniref:ABC transporter substrate-binding protein n=1 Tax=Leucobacter sp. Psy1 TaxID=2875729 RepID=UPI001CD4DDA3|nr:ABC transporter substrate-binding protein [Leucobacter sp. Psy1]UBH05195.1 ABC transporter substrate-binding protein [Leucobacter sp. Psy1]